MMASPDTSHRWCTGSCVKYWPNVRTVKAGAVAATTRAVPLVAVDRGKRPGDGVGGDRQFAGDGDRVLLAVALGDGGHILVPVGELRIVLGEHQGEPLFEQLEHVTDVTPVLERRPDVGTRPLTYRGPDQDVLPGSGVVPHDPRDVGDVEGTGIETALRALAFEHPRPVLVVSRHVGHRRTVGTGVARHARARGFPDVARAGSVIIDVSVRTPGSNARAAGTTIGSAGGTADSAE